MSLNENKNVNGKEEKNDINKWAHLPDEILELIMKRLCLNDYLALRTICSPWKRIVTNAITIKHCCPLREPPLIVLNSNKQVLFSLRTEREHYPKRSIYESTHIACLGSHEGWMIMSDHVEMGILSVFFFNPVTNRRVSVPPRLYFPSNSPIQDEVLFIRKMVASSGPDCCKPGCYLAGLFNDHCHIAFYKLFDKSWNLIETEKDSGVHFMDLEIMGSKLYVRTGKPLDSILVYDLTDSSNGSPKAEVLAMLPQRSTPFVSRMIDNQRHDSGYNVFSLAKHETLAQLFLINIFCNIIYRSEDIGYLNMLKEYVTPPEITGIEVFKMDMNKEPIKWIKCDRLDDDVIFVSGVKSMVMSRTSLNCTQALIRENSVYFAFKFNCPSVPWQGGALLGIKHLTDSSIKYFSIEESNHSKVPFPFWFVPSI
ncbi:uncharacterized protein LOC130712751 [Lotus japonicus]|uniref:uncharacterized protein LOC130712751 n=1 Tax=Lotus japonicus TaxID=34305 RepID=UPI00258298F5|nr:uncharacterized protein LOC130712751 [Lotus japonicus]